MPDFATFKVASFFPPTTAHVRLCVHIVQCTFCSASYAADTARVSSIADYSIRYAVDMARLSFTRLVDLHRIAQSCLCTLAHFESLARWVSLPLLKKVLAPV